MIVSVLVIFASSIMAVVSAIFIYKFRNRRFYRMFEQFPSFSNYPLIGNLGAFFNVSMNDCLEAVDKFLEGYDRRVCWVTSLMPVLILKKHDDIATVLSQCSDRDTLGLADEWIGTGILNAKYEEWKKSRKILTPAFNSEMLSRYNVTFNEKSKELVNDLRKVADTDKVVNVFQYVVNNNLNSVAENTMGISIHDAEEKRQIFIRAIIIAFRKIIQRMAKPWLYPHFIYHFYLKFTNRNKVINQLHCLSTQITRNKINDYRNKKSQFKEVEESKKTIDILIKEGLQKCAITEKRMTDELLQVIMAGVESSALIVSSLLLMLAIHEDVQQKVYEEMTELLDNEDTITEDFLLNQFDYLEQCIKETIRIFSPPIATIRRTHKDCLLKDKKIIPAKALVFLALHWSQLDEHLYENPHDWDPNHFSEQAVQNRPKESFLSFGYGPRYCLGHKYAVMSIKAQILHILRDYRLSTNIKGISRNDLRMELSIVIKNGYPVKFTSRQRSNL